ncbi:hypothetical protein HGQ98_34230, partial [Achromobacter ruhlandii]|nr:hypothetical protein [Achromobacter ruhlandii]
PAHTADTSTKPSRARSELRARAGFVLVSAVWAALPLLAPLPLLLYFPRARAWIDL